MSDGAGRPEVRLVAEVPAGVDAVAGWAFAGDADGLARLPHAGFLAATGFSGQLGETAVLPPAGAADHDGDLGLGLGSGAGPTRIVVGAGPRSGPPPAGAGAGFLEPGPAGDAVAWRRAGAELARVARRFRHVAVPVPAGVPGGEPVEAPRLGTTAGPGGAARAMVEGFLLGGYRFDRYRASTSSGSTGEPGAAVRRLAVVGDPAGAAAGVASARHAAAAVALARDLGNEPGGVLTPTAFAGRAVEVAGQAGLTCEVWDEGRISGERLGGLLAVGRGSSQPPRLVRLEYRPPDAPASTVALVGKGVTFDAGGLSLKPTRQLVDMKIDMAGAGAVLGAMSALPALGCQLRVVAWLPLAENMPDGRAFRLGDVLRIRNGTTVEVRNADAEGRLIMADALALAGEERPAAILDLATLTAAIGLAVGRRYAGLAGNHTGWLAAVRAAAERAGEPVWPLPMDGAGQRLLRSRVADLANVPGGTDAQSVVAAAFLREFVPPGIPWAHLDINGPAFTDEDAGELTPGATGFGVRTILELLCTGESAVACT